MKLISMTEFILSDKVKSALEYEESYKMIRSYANFLKEPLKLEMFVPCDEDGNVLEEPKIEDYFDDGFNFEFNQKHFKDVVLKEYYNAKEKVLFEGFEIIHEDKVTITIEYNHFQLDYNKVLNVFANHRTIEDLAKYNLIEITENAIKQIGL